MGVSAFVVEARVEATHWLSVGRQRLPAREIGRARQFVELFGAKLDSEEELNLPFLGLSLLPFAHGLV